MPEMDVSAVPTCPLCLATSTKVACQGNGPSLAMAKYWECLDCGLVFLLPAYHLNFEQERARYDLHRNHPDDQGYVRFLKRLVDPLCRKLKPDASGLDFGCGPSPVLAGLMRERGLRAEFYDPHYFARGDLLERTYDFIACSEVAEHFKHPRREFELLGRLLRGPGSCLGIMTQILSKDCDFEKWWYRLDPTHVCFYRPETLEWLCDWRGWTLERPAEHVALCIKA